MLSLPLLFISGTGIVPVTVAMYFVVLSYNMATRSVSECNHIQIVVIYTIKKGEIDIAAQPRC